MEDNESILYLRCVGFKLVSQKISLDFLPIINIQSIISITSIFQESCKKEGKGSCRTISPKNEDDVDKCDGRVGKQQKLSIRDVEKINKYYGCEGEY